MWEISSIKFLMSGLIISLQSQKPISFKFHCHSHQVRPFDSTTTHDLQTQRRQSSSRRVSTDATFSCPTWRAPKGIASTLTASLGDLRTAKCLPACLRLPSLIAPSLGKVSFQVESFLLLVLSVGTSVCLGTAGLTLILRRSRTGTAWFYTSTSNKREARPKLYTKSLTRDLKRMYSRLTLVRISINL